MEKPTACVLLMCLAVVAFTTHIVEARSVSANQTNAAGKCIIGKKSYNVGEQWSVLGDCSIYTCTGEGSVTGLPCAPFILPNGSPCTISEVDLKKMYPKCCPQMVCPPQYL